ncbi:MAG: class I SAM-dependent methyltransferase [Pseudonocardiaceae bacterium]
MLARRTMPPDFIAWNTAHGAPFGFGRADLAGWARGLNRQLPNVPDILRQYGPFAMQACSSTRRYEYPWVYHQLRARSVGTVVEVGGGLSGLQFVLSAEGNHVINIDPGDAGFEMDEGAAAMINEVLGTDVEIRRTRLADAGIPHGCVDAVISISTWEHLDDDELDSILRETRTILRPSGRLIVTVDLFLDLYPFTARESNRFGRNIRLWELLINSGYRPKTPNPDEVHSNPHFDPMQVMTRLEHFTIGDTYPVLAQVVVAAKRH